MVSRGPTESLLAAVAAEERDQLFPLVQASPVVAELTGNSPRRSALHRWAAHGISGVRLQTVTVGRVRFTTRRWLIEWFAAVDEARRAIRQEAR